MHVLRICVDVSPYKQPEFHQAVRAIMGSWKRAGVAGSNSLSQDVERRTLYWYTEVWMKKGPMDQHFQSEQFRSLLGAFKSLGEVWEAKLMEVEHEEEFGPASSH